MALVRSRPLATPVPSNARAGVREAPPGAAEPPADLLCAVAARTAHEAWASAPGRHDGQMLPASTLLFAI